MQPEITVDLLQQLRRVSTATVTTQLFKRGFRQQFLVGITPLNRNIEPFAGEAFTLRFIPSREDKDWDLGDLHKRGADNIQWEAAEAIPVGQVLVIDSRGDPRAASAGNMLLTRMMRRGVTGIVTDGSFRDGAEIARMTLPAYCRSVTSSTRPSFHRAVDMQLPIGCADVAVYPGDVVVGDADGVVVVPRHLAAEVAADGWDQELRERFIYTKIDAGSPLWGVYPPSEATLREYETWRKTNEAAK